MDNKLEQTNKRSKILSDQLAKGVDVLGGDGLGLFRECIGDVLTDLSDEDMPKILQQMHIVLQTDADESGTKK